MRSAPSFGSDVRQTGPAAQALQISYMRLGPICIQTEVCDDGFSRRRFRFLPLVVHGLDDLELCSYLAFPRWRYRSLFRSIWS